MDFTDYRNNPGAANEEIVKYKAVMMRDEGNNELVFIRNGNIFGKNENIFGSIGNIFVRNGNIFEDIGNIFVNIENIFEDIFYLGQ